MIRNQPRFLTEIDIAAVERRYNARYVFESCLQVNNTWRDEPSLIFYNSTPHPQGSHYFALSRRNGEYVISDGISAICQEDGIGAVKAEDGEIIYSACRHDFNTSSDGSVSIDGGRDYLRVVGGPGRSLVLEVVDGVLRERKDEHTETQG